MRIAIQGAGAIGCYLGARLSAAGHDVLFVGRPDQVRTVNSHGLLVRQGGSEHLYRLAADTELRGRADLVLLAVKTQDVAEAARQIAAVEAHAPVVALQNGVEADQIAADVLGADRVLGAVVVSAVSYLRPGEIEVQFPGWLIFGEPFGPPQDRTRAFAHVLSQAVPTVLTPNLPGARWSKVLSNLNNGLPALTGQTLVDLMAEPDARAIVVHLIREGYRVARARHVHLGQGASIVSREALRQGGQALGVIILQSLMVPLLGRLPDRAAQQVLQLASRGQLGRLKIRGSTWQSLARGRPTEIDYLNGAVVRLGQPLGIPTPFNQAIVDRVHQVEAGERSSFALSELFPTNQPPRAPSAQVGSAR